ncbi:MAG: flagellar hook-associated protein FlgK [Cellvibrionales bacterium]
MSDMFSIGANAIQQYRHSLTTVSNNIANLNTEGYSRQVSNVSESAPVEKGNIFLGTGARLEGVVRSYDQFTEGSLRNSNSDLETQQPQVQYANRIIDLMGSQTAGLSSALDQFFASAAELSTDPASVTTRGGFLRDADVLASRFRELAGGLATIDKETRADLNQQVATMNTLTEQMVLVNKQLARKSTAQKQPPGLLDQRDAILRDMSAVTRVHVTEQVSGQVSIRLGSSGGTSLVEPTGATMLGIKFSESDPGSVDLIANPYGDPEVTSTVSSGALGGLMSLRSQTLTPAMDSFDRLAQTLVKEVNEIHRGGLDAYGQRGEELFKIEAIFEVSAPTIAGDVDVAIEVVDPDAFKYAPFEMQYMGADKVWKIQDKATGAVSFSPSGVSVVEHAGLSLVFDGNLSDGDSFFIDPKMRPAAGMQMTLKDPMSIAAAALMRVVPANNNVGDAKGSVSFDQSLEFEGFQFGKSVTQLINNTNAVSDANVIGSNIQPAFVIPRGVSDVALMMDVPQNSRLQFQVMTHEGVHILGHAIDSDTQAGILSLDGGFRDGSQYSGSYLNGEGDNAYLNMGLTYGYLAESSNQISYQNNAAGTGLDMVNTAIPANAYSDRVTLTENPAASSIDLITNGALKLNGHSLGALTLAANTESSAAAMASWINSSVATLAGVTQATKLTAKADDLDYNKLVSINGTTIAHGSTAPASASDLVTLINAKTTTTHVVAAATALGGVTLSNASGYEGQPISLGNPDETSNSNGLGQANKTYTSIGVTATASTVINATKLNLDFAQQVSINGTTITGNYQTDATAAGLAALINAQSATTHVVATANSDGGLSLTNTAGYEGQNIALANPVSGSTTNALGQLNKIYTGTLSMGSDDKVRFTFGADGVPSDLAELGLRTGLYVDGTVSEDLAVFVAGEGVASISVGFTQQKMDASNERQKDAPFMVAFTSDSEYTITDTRSATVVATRAFEPGEEITYQNFTLALDSQPAMGDTFTIEENIDGVGNNGNILLMVDLQNKPVVDGYQTISDAYIDVVSTVGNKATLSRISQEALQVVYDQAVESRDAISGVSLDKEAADLIRFQQAYQASAQVIQVASKLFDSILGLR